MKRSSILKTVAAGRLYNEQFVRKLKRAMDELEQEVLRKEAETALVATNRDLEKRVRERTAQLEGLNDDLRRENRRRKRIQEERENLIEELRATLEQVRTLSGLLPICSHCHKIRDDKGY